MKRDIELVRKLLFYFEEKPGFSMVKSGEIHINGYDPSFVAYHVHLLCEAGFLSCERVVSTTTADRLIDAYPFRLTWAGHEFLDAARNESIWNQAKGILKEKGISVGVAVLQGLLVSLAKQQLRVG